MSIKLPTASATKDGILLNTSQTLAGDKTLNSSTTTLNSPGSGHTLRLQSVGSSGDAFAGILEGFGTTGNSLFAQIVFRRDTNDASGQLIFRTYNTGVVADVAVVDRLGAWVIGPATGGNTHTIRAGGGPTVMSIAASDVGQNSVKLQMITNTSTVRSEWVASSSDLFRVNTAAGTEFLNLSSSGDLSVGQNTTGTRTHTVQSGNGLVEFRISTTDTGTTASRIRLKNSAGANNDMTYMTQGAGLFRIFNGAIGTPYAQLDLTTGSWVFGNTQAAGASATTVTHAFALNNPTQAVLSLNNADTSTGSDASQALTIIKGSTTNGTTQNFIVFTINAGGTNSGRIAANGANTAAFQTFSDSRLKENIVDLGPQLDNMMALTPREFDYIGYAPGEGHQIGFVAQEMQTVYPDSVGSDTPEGMLNITGWDKTSARLVKAIQELKALNDALEARIDALENP